MLSAHRPTLIICAGYGGGLDPRLRVGDVVIDSRGQAVAAAAEACCAALPGQVFFGAIASQPHALETPAAKAALAHETGALAVDMETAAVARAAAEHGIPLIAVRAISDTAHDPLPVPMAHWFDLQRQRPRPLALLGYLARHWGRIAPFVRFVRGLPKARRALTEAVAHTILHAR
jgi:adenosylhomocysteine nucleosidase